MIRRRLLISLNVDQVLKMNHQIFVRFVKMKRSKNIHRPLTSAKTAQRSSLITITLKFLITIIG